MASTNGISVSYMNKLLHGRIAFDAGFNNHAYFTRPLSRQVRRAKYGMTLRDARRDLVGRL